MKLASALLSVFVTGEALGDEVPPSLLPILEDRDEIAAHFATKASDCLEKQDTDHVLFHGCIDWHSAAHASWALVKYANTGKASLTDYAQLSWLYDDADFSVFDQEMALLQENPYFEMPYGRAWLLRLAIEAEKSVSEADVGMATRPIFDGLLAYALDRERSALSESYSSLSWALLNLYDYSVHFGLTEQSSLLSARIFELYVEPQDLSCDYENELGGFMAVCTNWAMLVSRVLPKSDYEVWLDAFIARNGLPEPVMSPMTAHEYGLNFSRAWGLWAMYDHSTTRRLEIVDAYSAHFQAGYLQFLESEDDYYVAGHWVAQFGLFALPGMLD